VRAKKRVLIILVAAMVAGLLLVPGPAFATNCSGANPNDNIPDSDALNACLANGGTITLAPGSPGYIIDKPLIVSKAATQLISSAPPRLATLIAAPKLWGPVLKFGGGPWYMSAQYLKIDGNRPNRTGISSKCSTTDRTMSSDVVFYDNPHLTFSNNEVTRTLCGSALTVSGFGITVTNNYIHDNGHGREAPDAAQPGADGITVGYCRSGTISGNSILDATDIGIVLFSSDHCSVNHNTITQMYRHANMGIALHTRGPNDTERHDGTVVSANQINGNGLLSFGLSFGVHPVYPNSWVVGGTMTGNTVRGAYVNLDVDGVKSSGTIRARVGQNNLSNPSSVARYPWCGPTGVVNYARDPSDSQMMFTPGGWVNRNYDACTP